MIRTLWARFILWRNNICPKHLKEKRKYWDVHLYREKFYGKKCPECYKAFADKKQERRNKKDLRLTAAKSALEAHMETFKPKEEQWQTLNKK